MRPEVSPRIRLLRALERRNLRSAELAALECDRIELVDRLGLLLLLLEEGDARYEAAAVRFLGLWISDHPEMGFDLTRQALDALNGLPDSDAREALGGVLKAMGEKRAAEAL